MDRSYVLNKLNVNFKQFKEISMCVSNGFQPFVLNIFPHIQSQQTFPSLHEFVGTGGSIYNVLLQLQNGSGASGTSDRLLMERFQKGCASIEFMPVMKLSGRVEPINFDSSSSSFLSSATPLANVGTPTAQHSEPATNNNAHKRDVNVKRIPNDLHTFIGQRLPDELFFYQSIGLYAFELCEVLVHDNEVERTPSDMAVTPLYEHYIESSLEVKGKTLNLLANSLNRYYQFKKLHLTTYFKQAEKFDLVQKFQPPVYLSLKSLIIKHTTARSFDLNTLLSSLANDYLSDNTEISDDDSKISSNYELISTALIRAFVLYGLVSYGNSSKQFALTKWGEALQYITTTGKNQELLTLTLLFFKCNNTPILKLESLIKPNDLRTTNKKFKNAANLIAKFAAFQVI
ncbi:unnamed protein product [Ambrosiozyma monospora]|uniref:Unnamed protein product n=1 Tax=Ambrosiozyma monospora TaxID=43982 RepID=A0ACB5TJ35_AMBMO|nr:unnamed protein product [Ambrosiozyma monospora]